MTAPTDAEISAAIALLRANGYRVQKVGNGGRDHPPHVVKAVMDAANGGASYAKIAKAFGMTRSAVSGLVDRNRKRCK